MTPSTDFRFSTHAERLFIQLGQSPLKGKRGLPVAPSVWNEAPQRTWSDWDAVPCILLLGEPGSGKTREFLHWFMQLGASGHAAFMSRWQNWCDGDDVFATLNDHKGFFTALEARQTVWWFIDALDEGRIKTERAFDVIKKGLRELNEHGVLDQLRLRISCRSRDWRPTEASQLTSFFPDTATGNEAIDGVVTLQLLPLDDAAVRILALEKLGTQEAVNRFMEALMRRHVVPLSGQPLLLAMMLQLFQKGDETLGRDRTGLYARAVENLNTEHNTERRDQAPPQTMPDKRITIAKALAVHAVFGGKDAIAVPDTDSQSDRTLNAACSGAERREILETLNTGLFTQHTGNGFNFIHRSLTEYLTAVYLSERLEAGLPLGRMLPLFPVEYDVIPGPLRETAAWLAGLDARFRNWLIDHDPITAAQGDTARYIPLEREKLITTLAERFENRVWQREFDRFGDLARSVSDKVLRKLLQSENSLAVRYMIIEMIDAAEVIALFPDLLQIALDSSAKSTLRAKAAIILAKRAPADYAAKLRPLLELTADQDNDDEISGALLHYLYPQHLTTAQALCALHVPRNRSLIGLHSLFWGHSFLERMPPARSDRQLTLNTIVPLLKDHEDSIALRHVTALFTRLLLMELEEQAQDIAKLGPWVLKLAGWVRHHGTTIEDEYKQLVQVLRAKPQLRAAMFQWQLENWPGGKNFMPWWHLPFYDSITTDDDVPVFIELCREYARKPEIGKHIFELLVGLAYHSPYVVKLETLEALAKTDSNYDALWAAARVCALDGPMAQSHKEQEEYKAVRANQKTEHVSYVQSNIEALRTGNINLILNVIYDVNLEIFGDAPIHAIGERYGVNVAQAVHEGLVSVWDDLNDTSKLWPYSNELPNLAIAAGFGYRLQHPQLSSLNQHQIDYLVWRMLHHDNDTSALLAVLWEHHRPAVLLRLLDTLKRENSLLEEAHPIVWGRLASLDEIPYGLMNELVNHIFREGIPSQTRARQYALKVMLQSSRRVEVIQLVATLVNSEWCGQTLPAPWAEYAALSALAAWWLLDADKAFDVLENVVFQGRRHSVRAIGFINGLQELQGNYSAFNSNWTEAVSWHSYAKLFPLLYAQPPRAEPKLGGGRVTPGDQFSHARDSLVNHIAKAPPQLARVWFGAWKEDAHFGVHRDWFASIHTELGQRQADESWSPLLTDTVDQVFGNQASLVRSDIDLLLLLNEVIAQQLIPAFRSDYNLVPLLWKGTKGSGHRKHRDEKALQTAIYGQLMPMVRNRRIIGAREPEILDAKKPDIRLSYILHSGVLIDVPVEIKWADNHELWDATEGQVLKKYMQDPRVRHGIYLVGWTGPAAVKVGPNGEKPTTVEMLQSQLQQITDRRLAGTKKTITVHVIDASVPDQSVSLP